MQKYSNESRRSHAVTFILAFFFGFTGAHRFYVGRPWSGLFWLCTAGLLGFGWVVDVLMISQDGFTDGAEQVVAR